MFDLLKHGSQAMRFVFLAGNLMRSTSLGTGSYDISTDDESNSPIGIPDCSSDKTGSVQQPNSSSSRE